jgi:deoxyribodipyrimidine photo-lyase
MTPRPCPDENLAPLCRLGRADQARRLAAAFPDSTASASPEDAAAVRFRGGRAAAVAALAAIDPVAYGRTRNHVGGHVTRLSPWIRHGVLSLAEVRDAALARVAAPEQAEKLISELGWRDYWRQVHDAIGERLHDSLEPPAAISRDGVTRADHMPVDVLEARTGMACIDDFVRRLQGSGWLHNHERMWLASWLVHVRGVRWQVGADWFLEHLLDGDPASNHLSWQWVAGTFSAKPYLFNRENLETYTAGMHCRTCRLFGSCDVEGTYEELSARLFEPADALPARGPLRIRPRAGEAGAGGGEPASAGRPLVWLTLDSASAVGPAVLLHPDAPRLFVIDVRWLAEERPSLKRLVFLFECLADVPGLEIRVGDPAVIVPERARSSSCDGVVHAATPCTRVRRASGHIAEMLPVAAVPWPPFCDRSRVEDLGRFSRYWQKVSRSALQPTRR